MATASFKLSDAQMRRLRRAARAKNMSLSDYLRASALPNETARRGRVYRKNRVSGAVVDATPGEPITLEMVNEALAGYP